MTPQHRPLEGLRVLDFSRVLAAVSDVVLENCRPGVAARLGVDYGSLSKTNPRLVYASVSGFGQSGPMAGRPSYDIIAQAILD
jgi:CoA:oxalate CoA-transferase